MSHRFCAVTLSLRRHKRGAHNCAHPAVLHSAQKAKLSAWKNSEDVPSSVNGVDSVALDGARARVLAGPVDASDAARNSTSTRDGASNRNSSAYRG